MGRRRALSRRACWKKIECVNKKSEIPKEIPPDCSRGIETRNSEKAIFPVVYNAARNLLREGVTRMSKEKLQDPGFSRGRQLRQDGGGMHSRA